MRTDKNMIEFDNNEEVPEGTLLPNETEQERRDRVTAAIQKVLSDIRKDCASGSDQLERMVEIGEKEPIRILFCAACQSFLEEILGRDGKNDPQIATMTVKNLPMALKVKRMGEILYLPGLDLSVFPHINEIRRDYIQTYGNPETYAFEDQLIFETAYETLKAFDLVNAQMVSGVLEALQSSQSRMN